MLRVLSFLYLLLFQIELGVMHISLLSLSQGQSFSTETLSLSPSVFPGETSGDIWQSSISYLGHLPARYGSEPETATLRLKESRRRPAQEQSSVEINLRNKAVMDNEIRDAEIAREWDTLPVFLTLEDEGNGNDAILQHKKSLLYRVISQLPRSQQQALYYLTLSESSAGSRGLGGKHSIVLHMGGLSDAELAAVFVHEMGHVVDTGLHNGMKSSGSSRFVDGQDVIYSNDPSISFYALSWQNSANRRAKSTRDDFVSGYAMTDPFEDFAESYVMYVLHGKQFRSMLESSAILSGKYEFLKTVIFDGQEFDTGSAQADSRTRVFDVTLIAYSLKKFIGI